MFFFFLKLFCLAFLMKKVGTFFETKNESYLKEIDTKKYCLCLKRLLDKHKQETQDGYNGTICFDKLPTMISSIDKSNT